jgi:hypothetical protein
MTFVPVLKATAVSAERKLSAQRNGALTTPTTKRHVADEPLGVVSVVAAAAPRQTLAPPSKTS